MRNSIKLLGTALGFAILTGCASVPMGSTEADAQLKTFSAPPADKSGLYIYRDSFTGQALKKSLTVDGELIGETAKGVYFHRFLAPGKHVIGTESEFSDNTLTLVTEPGKNYYLRQYIKMGAFVGGAGLEQISEAQAQRDLTDCCKLAASK